MVTAVGVVLVAFRELTSAIGEGEHRVQRILMVEKALIARATGSAVSVQIAIQQTIGTVPFLDLLPKASLA
jgi:hypothetical protein